MATITSTELGAPGRYIDLGSPAELDNLGSQTVLIYCRPTAGGSEAGFGYIFSKCTNTGQNGFRFFHAHNSNAPFNAVAHGSSGAATQPARNGAANGVVYGSWGHYAATFNGGLNATDIRIFEGVGVDLAETASYLSGLNGSGSLASDASNNAFIMNRVGLGRAFVGDLAYVAVWNRVLTLSELRRAQNDGPLDVPDGLVLLFANGEDLGPNAITISARSTRVTGDLPPNTNLGDGSVPEPDETEISSDSIWSWYNHPTAIDRNGATYWSSVNSSGDVLMHKYVHATKTNTSFTLHAAFQTDDHSNPGFTFLGDGRIAAFYSLVSDSTSIKYRVSTNAEDISAWEDEQTVTSSDGIAFPLTYTNPRYLSGPGKLVLLSRRIGASEARIHQLVMTDDLEAWGGATDFFSNGAGAYPYLISHTDGVDTIHFFMSDQHPNEGSKDVSLYHFYAKWDDGTSGFKWYKSDGTEITASLPFGPSDATLVYDGSGSNDSSWNWDIKLDENGYPRVLFVKFIGSEDADIRYMFSRWNGSAWTTPVEITPAGGTIAYPGAGNNGYYAGGICFDAADLNTVYLSKETDGTWEIEKWTSEDDGATWSKDSDVTFGSAAGTKNCRPQSPLNNDGTVPVLWWSAESYTDWDTWSGVTVHIPAAGGGEGQVVEIGLATETDTALGVTALKRKAVGVANENDSALAATAIKTRAAGLATEFDSALAVAGASKAKEIGLATETDTALQATVVSSGQIITVGLAEETDSALGVTAAKKKAVGLATETDSALAVAAAKRKAAGLAAETDSALALGTTTKVKEIGLAIELDRALAATVVGGVEPEPEEEVGRSRSGMIVTPGRLMNP